MNFIFLKFVIKRRFLSKESINLYIEFEDFNPAEIDRLNLELSSNGLRVFNQKVDFNF